ncbi:2-amino-4-hydroxy-6-hydroxymethyldihydropteridinediphosphokinase [Seinonella peptonophila]|uniref:2-amino-4-hydroxy-6-hydroxymethyldihydropteridine diphosphokinase n=1 Tax=Seinonella peptonophila TaxID=112248 RepID=A0A1M4YTF4_9BACL|nr:2-amino-4-hydroxy-6-hydroxymethyldihydropteridine diphosphokinase [Seinonella peptonophila]SHF08742.1 2-amino-4-hydroxy-6-hydroxymethyldihydropteridinediphosphokinase [Seinonella peptonophila]
MNIAYLGLGSNQGDRLQHLQQAIQQINRVAGISISRLSSIYETAPVGYVDQGSFFNMVCEIEVELPADVLLSEMLAIEQRLKRTRTIRFGPRTIDIDILLFDHEQIHTRDLIVPHPRMWERAFVIIPLTELIPDYKPPTPEKTIKELGKRLIQEQQIKKLNQVISAT